MGHSYTSSRCILSIICLSIAAVVVLSLLSALLLFLVPEEPSRTFSGREFTFYPALGFLISALLVVLVGPFGCCAVQRDSKGVLLLFSVCVVIVAALELASGGVVFAFMYTNEIEQDISSVLTGDVMSFSPSANSSAQTDLVNMLQREYHCCGIQNYTDWRLLNTTWSHETKDQAELAPQSCCREKFIDSPNCTNDPSNLYSTGCVWVMLSRMKPAIDSVFGVSVIAAALLAFMSCTSCYGASLIWRYEQYRSL